MIALAASLRLLGVALAMIPVANIATFGLILIAPASSKYNTLAEVIAADKAVPGKLNWEATWI